MSILRALFGSLGNAALTVILLVLLFLVGRALLLWALGAEWWVVSENLRYFFVGQLPPELTWRAWTVLAGGLVALAGWLGRLGVLPIPRPGVALVAGLALGALALPLPITLWSGLFLSLLLSLSAMVLAFPLGVALAFARQSRLVALRTLAIVYIEAVRGVPLVSLLFLAFVILPLFLPEGFRLPQVVRALLAFTFFAAAYLAENVRGGLQAIPKGQWEAAYSLGLSSLQAAVYVVLPQALRAVIPALVGQFIALFKDTSLVALIGILDLMGVARAVLANPRNVGLEREVYLFLAVVYLLVSGAFSYVGRLVERRMGLGVR